MTKEKHNCDNVNCNHNDTKGLCCLFNPENCKYRQLQKENAELKEQNKHLYNDLTMTEAENAELKKLKRECETSLCRAEYQYNYEQLTKAKEIIKKLIEAIHIWDCKNLEQVEAEAERFLNSEVEND